ncbi:MAG: hypothetical protein HY862_20520 [Chloroflexi bacterium]|nr:hypothetical protein [Chloroflexota bacterium]
MNISQNWRLNPQRYTLEGATNDQGEVSFPPRPNIETRAPERYDFELNDETVEAEEAEIVTAQRVA